jgi:small conductance mechanosensitive channel
MLNIMLQISADSITNRFAGKASDWIATYGPRILIALVVFFLGQWIIRMLSRGLNRILLNQKFNPTLRPFLHNLLKVLLQVLLILGIMQLLGIQMTLFAAVIGAIGVAAGLALSGTLQNFAAGVLIILLKPFKVGDTIKTQGEEGVVGEIRLFYSVIKTANNSTLIIPNSKLSNETIFNLTREKRRRIDILLKFKYYIDFPEVEKKLLEASRESPGLLQDSPVQIEVEKLEEGRYTIILSAWALSVDYSSAKRELNQRIAQAVQYWYKKR